MRKVERKISRETLSGKAVRDARRERASTLRGISTKERAYWALYFLRKSADTILGYLKGENALQLFKFKKSEVRFLHRQHPAKESGRQNVGRKIHEKKRTFYEKGGETNGRTSYVST